MNFENALDVNMSDIERPPLPPVGTYRWVIEKIPNQETSQDDKWDFLTFPLKCLGAEDDVDSEALSTFGSLNNLRQSHRFIFDRGDEVEFKKKLYQVRRFLADTLQVDGADNMTIKEALAKSVNHQLRATIVWKPDKQDSELIHANIGKVAPIA